MHYDTEQTAIEALGSEINT